MGRARYPLCCAVLLLLTFVAYLPVWGNDFVDCDDEVYVTRNPRVLAGLSWSGFCWSWDNRAAPYWQPLTWLSLQFDAHFFARRSAGGQVVPSPVACHGQSLFWHGASVLLLFGVCRRLTGAPWRSFLVAALFAVHPLHVESVAPAAQRKDLLSLFFGLLALWAWAGYVRRPNWRSYLATLAAFLLSLMAKPMLMTLPCVLLLLDYWPFARWAGAPGGDASPAGRKRLGQLVWEKAPLFACAVAVGVVTLTCRARYGSIVSLTTFSPSARVANVFMAFGWYLYSTFYPLNLAAMYPLQYEHWSVSSALAGSGVVLSVAALCWWQARRRPWLLVGWLWFVGALFPVTGLVQGGPQAWAGRFSYWPHVGLFVALVWELGELVERFRVPMATRWAVAGLVLSTLAVLTQFQVTCWRNSVTLWEHAVAVTSDNDWAHQHLSVLYRNAGLQDEADAHLMAAVQIQRRRLRASLGRRLGKQLVPPARLPSAPSVCHGPGW
jgi:hypothetical protein